MQTQLVMTEAEVQRHVIQEMKWEARAQSLETQLASAQSTIAELEHRWTCHLQKLTQMELYQEHVHVGHSVETALEFSQHHLDKSWEDDVRAVTVNNLEKPSSEILSTLSEWKVAQLDKLFRIYRHDLTLYEHQYRGPSSKYDDTSSVSRGSHAYAETLEVKLKLAERHEMDTRAELSESQRLRHLLQKEIDELRDAKREIISKKPLARSSLGHLEAPSRSDFGTKAPAIEFYYPELRLRKYISTIAPPAPILSSLSQ